MAKIQDGTVVKVHYTGKLNDGTVFDTSDGREPLEFTIGQGQVIPGFENAVKEMEPGEKKTITIPSDEAYGPHNQDMVIQVPKEHLPADIPQDADAIGQQLLLRHPSGQEFPATIVAVSEDQITLDANHPLAGHDLTFDIELVAANQGTVSCSCGPCTACS